MKIRRALTAAAAAAVIAPATVLAAPAAAFATEPVAEAGPRTPCAFESDQLQVAVHGLPSQLTAGGAWTPFSMSLANTTGKPLAEVQPFLLVSSAEDVDRPYWELETEYRDAKPGEPGDPS
ncbi:hypothetical protein [Streptomyces sp. 769]|uniref:hypothetical protein n=1 Tax=Streptomyces sp. 769 TaxID=1262452 RepID=UPI000581D799|nr:hypothetical protein [Streptomyces sp. 769]AJC60889.1 hypothetical protein GZL_08361 [Streptomyces sp. 769]